MIPEVINDGLTLDFEEEIEPSNTFKINNQLDRCYGTVDELEAMKQAVFLMLDIERYDYLIYSWNTGFEANDLIGQPIAFVVSEVKRRIRETLLQDDRITEVDSFIVTTNKNKVHVQFTAHTIYGEIPSEKEVDY